MLMTAGVCEHLILTPAHVAGLKRRFVARCLLCQQVGHLPSSGSHISLLLMSQQLCRLQVLLTASGEYSALQRLFASVSALLIIQVNILSSL
jgi:hypothetical protein